MPPGEQYVKRHLWIVRHGQSAGNVARDHAEATGAMHIELAWRDLDVPLSNTGIQQAEALADWLMQQPPAARPHHLYASPYVRALATASILRGRLQQAGGITLQVDERLREKALIGLAHR